MYVVRGGVKKEVVLLGGGREGVRGYSNNERNIVRLPFEREKDDL